MRFVRLWEASSTPGAFARQAPGAVKDRARCRILAGRSRKQDANLPTRADSVETAPTRKAAQNDVTTPNSPTVRS